MKKPLTGKLVIPLAGSVQPSQPRRKPHNPRTLPQQMQRNIVGSVSAHWRELTDNAREAWRALGPRLRGQLSGHQAYVKINVTLAQCGVPQVELPPAVPALGPLTCAGLVADDTPQVKLLQVRSLMGGADRLIIEATAPVSAGIQNVDCRYRTLAIVPGPTAAPADVDLTAAYIARFGLPHPGRRIFMLLTLMSNGFKGQPLPVSALVAPHAG